jgi:hypothetical protein
VTALRNPRILECVSSPISPPWCPRSCTKTSGANTLARRTIRGDVRSSVRHTSGAPRRLNCASLLCCTCRVRAAASGRCRLHRSRLGSHTLDRFPSFGSRGPRATPQCAFAEALPRRRQVESARLERGGDEGVARSECRILASHSSLHTGPSPVMLQLSSFNNSILAPNFHLGAWRTFWRPGCAVCTATGT